MENSRFRIALGRIASRARDDLGAHPDSETLVAYSKGALTQEEANMLRAHLALCAQCVFWYLAAYASGEPGRDLPLTPEELEADWQALRCCLIIVGLIACEK